MSNPLQRFTMNVAAARVWTICSVMVVSLLGARPTHAQPKPAPGDLRSAIGSVDIGRTLMEYKERQKSSEQVQAMRQSLNHVLERLRDSSAVILPEAEATELSKIYEKSAPTDAEKKRSDDLEKKARSLSDELRGLQNVANPSDQQRQRLSELAAQQRKTNDALQNVQSGYEERLQQMDRQLTQKLGEDIKAAVAKVAQDKNLAVVFDSQVALYTSNDITADVLKQLNK